MIPSADVLSKFVERIGGNARLDRLARPLTNAVNRSVPKGLVKDTLSGVWLGHSVHPMLTDLPIGFWTAAFTLDLLGGRKSRATATRLVGWGLLTAVPTAASGASDWADTVGPTRRVGLAHAAANTTAFACYGASWWARRHGRHGRGVALGLLGATAATVGGYLGGHLTHSLGTGVDNTAFENRPSEWTAASAEADVTDDLRCVAVEGAAVVLFRHDGELVALGGHCPHRGAPMDEGSIDGDSIVCAWHGSRFRLADGHVMRGPSAWPLPCYETRVRDGQVEVRSR